MRTFAESRELAGFTRPVERASENQREGLLGENGLQESRGRTPVLRERNIRHTGMLPTQAPLGFPVPHQINFLLFPCHGSIFRRALSYFAQWYRRGALIEILSTARKRNIWLP
jgi:hypothetical protein